MANDDARTTIAPFISSIITCATRLQSVSRTSGEATEKVIFIVAREPQRVKPVLSVKGVMARLEAGPLQNEASCRALPQARNSCPSRKRILQRLHLTMNSSFLLPATLARRNDKMLGSEHHRGEISASGELVPFRSAPSTVSGVMRGILPEVIARVSQMSRARGRV